jgi:predicted helicase
MVEANTERVDREKTAEIMVVIGNPPYNVGQKSENENNKNRKYPVIDARIRETYAKASTASNKNALGDVYVKFFRWATDRLGDRDGIVCLVTNNSFVDQIAFDGMRKCLLQDFTHIYHLDLHGNVRKNPKLSGSTHNVFGIQVGVGITIAVKSTKHPERKISYYRVPEFWTRTEKLDFLVKKKSIANIEWIELQPDERNTWITEGLRPEFGTFLPLGSKEARSVRHGTVEEANIKTIFKTYALGPRTSRDDWMYDFNRDALTRKVTHFVEAYNGEVDRWRRRGNSAKSVDDFVTYDDRKIKWSEGLKLNLRRGNYADDYNEAKVRMALYRPFCKQWLYLDRAFVERVYQFPQFFPTPATEQENKAICLTDLGSEKPFMVLASNTLVDIHLVGAGCGTQCFPYYTYTEDGNNRRENITDWALEQFREKYGPQTTKWDIFSYIYALLHHPQYRERYKDNLKRSLPHLPLVQRGEDFFASAQIGMQLMNMHINYENVKEADLMHLDNQSLSYSESRRVEKMRISPDRVAVIINKSLTLSGIPPECFQYRLGNRSALEWVIDQYQVTRDKQGNVVSDPNQLDDKDYIIRLVKQVVAVSVQTIGLVRQLEQMTNVEDWIEKGGQHHLGICPTDRVP